MILNRAFKIAREEPSGPVFISLPINVMEQDGRNPPMAPARLFPRTAPDPAGIDEAAALLVSARNPVIICGDGVARANALHELVAVAEQLGGVGLGEVLPARLPFPTGHPNFRDRLAGDFTLIRQMLGGADTVLLVGANFSRKSGTRPGPPSPTARPSFRSTPHQASSPATSRSTWGWWRTQRRHCRP